MSANIKVDLSRHVGVSVALAATAGFAAGYFCSRLLSASGRTSKDSSHNDMADASSTPDTPRTNGSSDAALQRFNYHFIRQENQPGGTWNGSLMELGEVSLVLALLVRRDLQMSTGQTAKHCSTASLGQFKKLYKIKSVELRQWELTDGKKICLGVSNEEDMLDIQAAARKKGIPTRTVIDERSMKTVLALGPAPVKDLNPLLLHLKEL